MIFIVAKSLRLRSAAVPRPRSVDAKVTRESGSLKYCSMSEDFMRRCHMLGLRKISRQEEN